MHRTAAWGLSAALAAGVTAAALAAEPAPSESKPWYARFLGGESKKPEHEKTFGSIAARPAVVYGPMDPAAMTEALKAEQSAYQRRLDVCLKLRQIAVNTGDDSLTAQADDLERQATALYHARSAKLGVKAALRTIPEATELKSTAGVTVAVPQPSKADQFREVDRD